MNFIGGGAKTPQEWLDFLGEVKDKRVPPVGSPFQINFNPNDTVPEAITPAVEQLPSCGDALLTCSCADCPVAPGCTMVGAGMQVGLWCVGDSSEQAACSELDVYICFPHAQLRAFCSALEESNTKAAHSSQAASCNESL
jgi:Niemann-Pick C1 protein